MAGTLDALMLRERIWSTEPGFYQIKGESTLDLDLAADTSAHSAYMVGIQQAKLKGVVYRGPIE